MQPGWAGSSARGAVGHQSNTERRFSSVLSKGGLWLYSFKKFDYVSEIETESENTLACLSGA